MVIKPENDLSSRERVYQCIVELTNYHRAASRNRIAELTGLKLHIVDEQIRQLKNTDKIRKLENGCYELVLEFPPDEMVSLSHLPNGLVRVEKGAMVMDCTPSEARTLGMLMAGYAAQLAAIHAQKDTEVRIARLENRAREARQFRDAVVRKIATPGPPKRQRELELGPKND